MSAETPKNVYVAMLRGVNVGGHKTVKMEQLRRSFTDLGFRGVRTHVQSGNVVFETEAAVGKLAAVIEGKLSADLGFSAPVLIKSAVEMRRVVERNPFTHDAATDCSKLHVTFLSADPPKNAQDLLSPLATASEKARVSGREVYLSCPDGYGRTKLSNTAIEKKLSVGATTRNWSTVKTLLAMARLAH